MFTEFLIYLDIFFVCLFLVLETKNEIPDHLKIPAFITTFLSLKTEKCTQMDILYLFFINQNEI